MTLGQDWLLWVQEMNLDLGTLLPLCQREDISHKGHGMAAAELKWTLVGQLLSGNTSHSQGLCRIRRQGKEYTEGWLGGRTTNSCRAALVPWLGDRNTMSLASCCSLL